MKLIHSSNYRLRTITMSFALILAAVSGIGVATSFVAYHALGRCIVDLVPRGQHACR